MNEHEEKTIKTFFQAGRKERYFNVRGNPKKRSKWLDKLNHTPGLVDKYFQVTKHNTDIYQLLKAKGAPETCYVISSACEIDSQVMELEEAISQTELLGWGTIISCIPGTLAYYFGELGEQQGVLIKTS